MPSYDKTVRDTQKRHERLRRNVINISWEKRVAVQVTFNQELIRDICKAVGLGVGADTVRHKGHIFPQGEKSGSGPKARHCVQDVML